MFLNIFPSDRHPRCRRKSQLAGLSSQNGVILLFALIAMMIMFVGAAAVVKSMNTSLTTAGSLAFRRDMVNQADLALSELVKRMQPGGQLSNLGQNDNIDLNYSSIALLTNAEGIPWALLDDEKFKVYGKISNDFNENSTELDPVIKDGLRGINIRYLIERLCEKPEKASLSHCVESSVSAPGGTAGTMRPPLVTATVYRVTIRASGPREVQAFVQASITIPE